jgi:hypothetical protein
MFSYPGLYGKTAPGAIGFNHIQFPFHLMASSSCDGDSTGLYNYADLRLCAPFYRTFTHANPVLELKGTRSIRRTALAPVLWRHTLSRLDGTRDLRKSVVQICVSRLDGLLVSTCFSLCLSSDQREQPMSIAKIQPAAAGESPTRYDHQSQTTFPIKGYSPCMRLCASTLVCGNSMYAEQICDLQCS